MLDRPDGQKIFSEHIDEQISQLKKQITIAINEVNKQKLKEIAIQRLIEAGIQFDKLYKESKEHYKKIILENYITCFFILVSIKTNYNLLDQLLWWQSNKSSQTFDDLDSSLIYCIDCFLKTALENKNKELILERYNEILGSITDLNIDEINCKKAKIKLNIYKNLALKIETPKPVPQFDITDLYKLPHMDEIVRSNFKVKIIHEIKKTIEKLENAEEVNNLLLLITNYLSAYLICGIYIFNDNNSFQNKHKERMLKDHEENFKDTKIKLQLPENNSILTIAKNIAKILTLSFTWDDILYVDAFVSEIKQLMDELLNEITYATLNKIIADLSTQLDYFLASFNLAFSSLTNFIKVNRMCNINMSEVLLAHEELNHAIKNIPYYCTNIHLYIYQQQIPGYIYLIKNNKENKEFYKTMLQENYRNIIHLNPDRYPSLNELNDVQINIYDIDDELGNIVKKFKLDINAISKKNLSNLNLIRISIFEDVKDYIYRVASLYKVNMQLNEKYNSKLKYPLSDNLMQLINNIFNILNIINQRVIIIFCCIALEQLIKGCEFHNYFPDICDKIMFETLRHKANQYYYLITYRNFDHNRYPYAKECIDTIISIRNHKDYQKIEDTKLLELYPYLIDVYLQKEDFDEAYFYLLQAISIFPDQCSLFEKFDLFKKRMEREKALHDEKKLSEVYKKLCDESRTLKKVYQLALEKERVASIGFKTIERQIDYATVLLKMYKDEERRAQQKFKNAETYLNILKSAESRLITQRNEADDATLLGGAGKKISVSALKLLFNLDIKLRKLQTKLIFHGSALTRWIIFHMIKMFNPLEDPHVARYFLVNDIDGYIPCESHDQKLAVIELLKKFGLLLQKGSENKTYLNFSLNIDGTDIDLTVTAAWYSSYEPMVIRMGRGEFTPIKNKEDYFNYFLNNITNTLDGKRNFLIKVNRFYLIIEPPKNYEDLYIETCQLKIFPVCNPHKRFTAYCYNIFNYWQKFANVPILGLSFRCDDKLSLPVSMVSFQSNPTLKDDFFQSLITHFDRGFSIKDYSIYFEMNEFIKKGIPHEKEEVAALFIAAFYFSLIKDLLYHANETSMDKLKSEAIEDMAKDCARNFIKIIAEHKKNNSKLLKISSLKSLKNYIDKEAMQAIEEFDKDLNLESIDKSVNQTSYENNYHNHNLRYYQSSATFYPAKKLGNISQQLTQNGDNHKVKLH